MEWLAKGFPALSVYLLLLFADPVLLANRPVPERPIDRVSNTHTMSNDIFCRGRRGEHDVPVRPARHPAQEAEVFGECKDRWLQMRHSVAYRPHVVTDIATLEIGHYSTVI